MAAGPAISSKQPENMDVLTLNMLIGQAVSQTPAIFALTIAVILINSPIPDTFPKMMAILGAGLCSGLGAIGPGLGHGFITSNANRSIAKNPKHLMIITRQMLIGQAVTETTDIYALIVAMILIFVV